MPRFTDLTAALAATTSDAVLLVTPPDGHLAQARQIFAASLPLLAEKPLTLDLPEAVAIVDLAAQTRLPLVVGLNFRYLPVSQKIRELVATEAVGAPGFGQFTYQRNRDGKLPWLNKYPLTMRHPMMLEQSIHHLDLLRFCYGREVEAVSCRTWNPPWSMYAHDSNVSCLLQLAGGLEANYLGTWTGGWNELRFEWRTDCAEGVIVQRGALRRPGRGAHGGQDTDPCGTGALRTLLRRFRRALRALWPMCATARRWSAAAQTI